MATVYLDHNATTPVRPEVLESLMPFFATEFGNPSSGHHIGQRARKAVEDARESVAALMGAESPDEIVFTSGGTEANNMAIRGALEAQPKRLRRVVSSAIEHSSVRTLLRHLAEIGEIDLVVVPVQPDGIVRLRDVEDAMTPDTGLVAIMAANNEIGTLQPLAEIAAICRRRGVPLLSDAVQWAGKLPLPVASWGADFASISGHKLGAPKGVGALYVRRGSRIEALIRGGRQEKNRRGGTENVPAIVGLGRAAALAAAELGKAADIARRRDLFEQLVMAELPLVSINGHPSHRLCNTTNLCIEYTDSSSLLMALDIAGVAASSGSACAAGQPDPSHVLLALGLPQEKAHASIRFSLSHSTTEEDIRFAARTVVDTVRRQRANHPLWDEANAVGNA